MDTLPPVSIKSGKPPFLFRAASDDTNSNASRGLNTAFEIDPLFGTGSQYEANLFGAEKSTKDKARFMIYDHINYNYNSSSEFSSWSTSLPFVVQHAIRKTWSQDEGNVLIYAANTELFEETRIHSALDLLREYDLEDWATYKSTKTKMSEYARGEYLIHGKLINTNGLWQAVPLQQLIDAGLWEVFPSLERTKKNDSLHQRLLRLRKLYFGPGEPLDIDPDIMKTNINVAKCFGKDLEGITALALISSMRRDLSEEKVVELHKKLVSINIPKMVASSDRKQQEALRSISDQWEGVPEAQQLIRLLCRLADVEAKSHALKS